MQSHPIACIRKLGQKPFEKYTLVLFFVILFILEGTVVLNKIEDSLGLVCNLWTLHFEKFLLLWMDARYLLSFFSLISLKI
jgi:hypothetical protein